MRIAAQTDFFQQLNQARAAVTQPKTETQAPSANQSANPTQFAQQQKNSLAKAEATQSANPNGGVLSGLVSGLSTTNSQLQALQGLSEAQSLAQNPTQSPTPSQGAGGGEPTPKGVENGNILKRMIAVGSREVGYYQTPTLKGGGDAKKFVSVDDAIASLQSATGQMQETSDLMRLRSYGAISLYINRNPAAQAEYKETYAQLKKANQTVAPAKQHSDQGLQNLAAQKVYQKHIDGQETQIREQVQTQAPGLKVDVQVLTQKTFDKRVFHPQNHQSILESGATGPAKGVNRFVESIAQEYAQLEGRESHTSVGTVTTEGMFIQQCHSAWDVRPEGGHAVVMINGHSGRPSTGNVSGDEAFKGIRMSDGSESWKVLGPGAEDFGEWKKALSGAKPGDIVVINSCDGATTPDQQVQYARMVEACFPDGVQLLISNGKAQGDARSVDGYVAFSKPVTETPINAR